MPWLVRPLVLIAALLLGLGMHVSAQSTTTPEVEKVRLSPEAIARLSDDDLEDALIGYVAPQVASAQDQVAALHAFPPPVRHWYIAFLVDGEVLNGGFNQFFFNPSGVFAGQAPAALAALGIPAAGALVEQAAQLLERHGPALEAAQQDGTIEAFMETYIDQPFAQLDEQYAERQDEWRAARLKFIRSHADAFRNL